MLDRLPVLIDSVSFSERGKKLSGIIETRALPRLSEMLLDNSGVVEIDVSFDKEGRLSTVQGEIKANLIVECQSCLKQLDLPISRSFKLGLVNSLEQADSLASDCEPLIVENDKISLNELVEDELLLSLPDFPKHDYQCIDRSETKSAVNDIDEEIMSNNPFSVLAKLKNTGD